MACLSPYLLGAECYIAAPAAAAAVAPHDPLHPQVRVAIIREEGSNGDREMAAAVYAAGMEPWDITMSDLIGGRAQLDSFRGIIFVGECWRGTGVRGVRGVRGGYLPAVVLDSAACCQPAFSLGARVASTVLRELICAAAAAVGGFSYADVLDSAKGWAATIRFNERVLKQFQVGG